MANNPSQRRDGHMYYVVGQEDGGGHITIVNSHAERNAVTTGGFVLVRDAHKGDPTVHRGWAMYIKDGTQWIKVVEEENVENEYGLSTELLNMFVTTGAFKTHVDANEAEHVVFRKNVADLADLITYKHNHTNKEFLDLIGDKYNQLTYRGKAIGQGPYIYEEFNDEGKLIWKNPTATADVEPTLAANSHVIANQFATTDAAYNGLTLLVVEEDKSISSFVIVKEGDSLVAKHSGRYGGSNLSHQLFGLQFVNALPEPSPLYAGEMFFLTAPGYSGQRINRTYEVAYNEDTEKWFWDDIQNKFAIEVEGPKITTCYRNRWNKICITWEDPVDNEDASGRKICWNRTVLVRKYGSVPTSISDGVVVVTSTIHNKYKEDPFVDVCPLSGDRVYYGVFSVSNSENEYPVYGNTSEAVFPDWVYIKELMSNGFTKQFFKVGDMFALPYHKDFGDLAARVTKITDDDKVFLTLATPLEASLCYDGAEHGYRPVRGNGQMGKTTIDAGTANELKPDASTPYYKFAGGQYVQLTSSEYSYGDAYTDGKLDGTQLFVNPKNPAYEETGSSHIKHGSSNWDTCNLNKWLNAKTENWFTGATMFDTKGISYEGFLYRFDTSYDGDTNFNFLSLIEDVRIPESSSDMNEVEKKNGEQFWLKGSVGDYTAKSVQYSDAGVAGPITGDFPEREHRVVPVFVLGVTAP